VQEGNELGLVESDQTYDQADLDSFFKKLASNIPNGTHPVLNLMNRAKGPGTPSPNNTETMLDIEIAYPLVYPAGITMFQTSGGQNAILDGLDNVYCDHKYQCGLYEPTNVISVSWEERESGAAVQTRVCNEYMKLGMQGVSALFASGDEGIAARYHSCGANGSFVVQFPSSCPYVTPVGATMGFPSPHTSDYSDLGSLVQEKRLQTQTRK
jgi:tripeptidyl-peptidase-1